ncbi:serine hydrolase [Gorillibacterium massiliense]|uniref:serine hydrolase n=1 Tax=Gorillibacterium massiliense TaxID=1280390 RepID=UPI000594A67C|nr:serine hydrolase [Gorillibacterium massiliense]
MLTCILAAALLLPSSVFAADPQKPSNPKLDKEDVTSFADHFFQQKEVQDDLAGAILVIVKDGEVLLNKGYGYADIAAKKPVDPDHTLFRIASVSKLFTAVGTMQLKEAGKVDLDKDVQAYLPDLKIPNNTGFPVTLKHLMTHTSGFDLTDSMINPSVSYSLERFIKDTVPTVVQKPGEVFRYDNYGFNLQGYIIQKMSGLPFQDYMTRHVFEPLAMDSSSYMYSERVKQALAKPYDNTLTEIEQYGNVPDCMPDGGMFTTGADMARFLLAMTGGGQLGNSRILSESSIKEMEKKSVTIHPDMPGIGYGLESSYPQFYNGYTVVEKGGDLSGFHSNLSLLPDQHTGIFLSLNSDKGNLRSVFFEQFMNRYFPKTGNGPTFVTPEPSKQQLSRFEGLYQHLRTPAFRSSITATEGALIVEDLFGTHTLRQTGDLLFCDENGMPAGFKLDANGNVLYLSYNYTDSWLEKLPPPAKFKDVADDHPYAKYIYQLVQMGAIPEGTNFEPGKPITRSQFIGQIIPLLGFQLSLQPASFTDTSESLYAAEIQTAYEYGIIRGYPDGTFHPDEPITREEAAAIIWSTAKVGLGAAPVQAGLKTPASTWASVGVQFVVGKHLYGPDAQSAAGLVEYRPHDKMLNQEAAALIYLFLQNLLS